LTAVNPREAVAPMMGVTKALRPADKRQRISSDRETQMLKTASWIAAIGIAALALPAVAGNWPNVPARKAPANASQPATPIVTSTSPSSAGKNYEYVGGDSGWQLTQHKYVRTAGRWAHSDECDHAIRIVKAPTPAEIESARAQASGG
jgi:hypothetical protein